MSTELMNRMRNDMECPECKGTILHKMSESYCTKCGLVVDEFPVDDNDTEGDGEGNVKNTRTGPPLKLWEQPGTLL